MKAADYLSKTERQEITRRSDWLAARMLLTNWLIVWGAFLLAYYWTNPLTILIALCLIAGRLLGIGVIMHECGHNSFFATKRVNRFFGQWFAGKLVLDNLHPYAEGHKQHHRLAGTEHDTDRTNYNAYPIEQAGLKRKITRDLTGQTGVRFFAQKIRATAEIFSADPEKRRLAKPYISMWLTQLAFIALLHFTLSAWLYLLWLGSTLTLYMLVSRVRQIAEHAAVPNALDLDPRMNTRTTYANFFERLLVAPNNVNYHLEHHLMASVPAYRLKAFHRLLKERGAYRETKIFASYADVLRHVTTLPTERPDPQLAY